MKDTSVIQFSRSVPIAIGMFINSDHNNNNKKKKLATFKEDVRHEILIKTQLGSSSTTVFTALSTQFSGFQIFVFEMCVLVLSIIAE